MRRTRARVQQAIAGVMAAALIGGMLALTAPAAAALPPSATAAVDARERVVVPLDAASAFALDPANDRPVELGEGPAGSVRIAIPSTGDDATIAGTVQVFRAGPGAPAERWLGEIPGSVVMADSATADFAFPLPAGEYVIFVEGFAHAAPAGGIWSWVGGGFDATAAETVSVVEDEEVGILLPSFVTAPARARVSDSFGDLDAEFGVYAAIERDDRVELMPVARVRAAATDASPVFPALRGARYTLGIAGSSTRTAGWLGGTSLAGAELRSGDDLFDVRVEQQVYMQLGKPLVLGTAAVGQDLMADHADSPFAPASARGALWHYSFGQAEYQWLADGKPIAGATSSVLRVTSAMAGKRLSYRVTASAYRFASATATSLATPRVTAPIRATVRGTAWPGHTMTMSPGSWPAGTTLSYQWLMNGQPIAGATGTSLAVPSDGGGTTISVLVTAKRAGYETVAVDTEQYARDVAVHPLRVVSGVAAEFASSQAKGTLRGSVVGVDTANVPLAGARVRVYSTGTGLASTALTFVKEVRTDGAGQFAVTGLTPGSYCTIVTSPNVRYASVDNCHEDLVWSGARVFAGAESDASVGLWPPGKLVGTISGSNGKKVAGATVNVYRPYVNASGSLSHTKVASARTDSAGRYSVTGLDANYYNVEVVAPSALSHKTAWWDPQPGLKSSVPTKRSAGGLVLGWNKTTTANATLLAYVPIGTPKATGTARVGGTLTASHPKTSGAKYTYQWYASGKAIKGATKKTFTVTSSQRSKAITVRVIATLKGYTKTTRTSPATAKVIVTAAPKIKGTPKVGRKLTASPGTWTSGTTLTYQWYNNGKAIAGAKKKTYVLKSSDRGDRITVKVKGAKKGYATATRTSAKTTRIWR